MQVAQADQPTRNLLTILKIKRAVEEREVSRAADVKLVARRRCRNDLVDGVINPNLGALNGPVYNCQYDDAWKRSINYFIILFISIMITFSRINR